MRNGDAVVVLATESRRASILQRLRLEGVDVGSAIEARRYVPLDVPDSLPKFQMAEHLTSETVRAAAESNLRVVEWVENADLPCGHKGKRMQRFSMNVPGTGWPRLATLTFCADTNKSCKRHTVLT